MSRTDKDASFRVRLARGETDDCTIRFDPPPRWFIRARFCGPGRRRVNRAARLTVLDYNTYGDTEVEISTDQHRQGAKWLWW